MESLKLAAFDADDLAVVSAHLQDAVIRVGDLAFQRDRKHFALLARRFDWGAPGDEARRRLSGLHFARVLGVRSQDIDLTRPDDALELLAITFSAGEAPAGSVTLVFAGGAAIELDLECIEAGLKDLGPAWSARSRPAHAVGDG